MTTTKYLTCAETAKLVREALKANFPGITFSVRSSVYSGGSSIDIGWTDGPTTRAVDLAAGRFAGADFDGMRDLKTHHPITVKGELVRTLCDFIFTRRAMSRAFLVRALAEVEAQYGPQRAEIVEYSGGGDCYIHGADYETDRRIHEVCQALAG